MTAVALAVGVLSAVVLAGIAVCLSVLLAARSAAAGTLARVAQLETQVESSLQTLQASFDALGHEVHGQEPMPPVVLMPGTPRPSLNLAKRTQALRMHRHGEPDVEIARKLDLPRQEVDLLLKVHKIVIRNIP